MIETLIAPRIAPYVDAALAAGFTVYAHQGERIPGAGHVYVCRDIDGPFALIQIPTHSWDPVHVDVPIKPHRDYGSSVLVDHDDTPEGVVAALEKACAEPMVTVRFMTKQYIYKHGSPVVPNHGRKSMIWKLEDMVKLEPGRTNWQVKQQAGRLEVGDTFHLQLEDGRDTGFVTVADKRYSGDYVIITGRHLHDPLEFAQRQFVTLLQPREGS